MSIKLLENQRSIKHLASGSMTRLAQYTKHAELLIVLFNKYRDLDFSSKETYRIIMCVWYDLCGDGNEYYMAFYEALDLFAGSAVDSGKRNVVLSLTGGITSVDSTDDHIPHRALYWSGRSIRLNLTTYKHPLAPKYDDIVTNLPTVLDVSTVQYASLGTLDNILELDIKPGTRVSVPIPIKYIVDDISRHHILGKEHAKEHMFLAITKFNLNALGLDPMDTTPTKLGTIDSFIDSTLEILNSSIFSTGGSGTRVLVMQGNSFIAVSMGMDGSL